jgi:SAM-dependent methyltransferase
MELLTPAPKRQLVQSRCRWLDSGRHPLLRELSRDEIYDGGSGMAPGGLLLAQMLASELALETGEKVLDLGCGRGQSSVYLASRYEVQVISLDLWIASDERAHRAESAGVAALVTALQGDVCRGLPIERGSLDAIFCMQAFHCFGTRSWVLDYLVSLLRPGGRIGIAQGCFREEPEALPALFSDTDGWHAEYEKYHSTGWWRDHLSANPELTVTRAEEVLDGEILWEDDILYRGERCGWNADFLARTAWLIRHVLHGQQSVPSLTHCLTVAVKNKATECPPD